MNIPKENTPEAIAERREIIKQKLAVFKDKSFPCPCLGVNVLVTSKSINEVAKWACLRYQSTMAAFDIPNQLKIAKFHAISNPKINGQKKKFKFIVMYEVHGHFNGKQTKIMIGAKENKQHIQYCITAQE